MKLNYLLISALTLATLVPSLPAQNKTGSTQTKKDQAVAKKKGYFTKDGKGNADFEGMEPEIGILVEYISLESSKANELLGKFAPKASDAAELRDSLEEMIDKGNAELVETVWVRSGNGQRAKTESVREEFYPTEYNPPELPYVVATNPENPKIDMTHASPAVFGIRNVGATLEVDPILSSDHKTIGLSLSPEIITRLEDQYLTRKGFEKTARGVDNILMANFYTIKDTCQIEVAPGKYNLLGIHTPHDDANKQILVLLRADLIPLVAPKK